MKTFRPHHPGHRYWTFVVLVAILYNVFAIPFRLGFSDFPMSPNFLYFDLIADIILLLDININLHTAVLDQGELITDPSAIRRHYLQRKGRVDLLASLPLDWLLMATTLFNPTTILLLRSLRLLRIGRIFQYFRHWEGYIRGNPSVIRAAQLLMVVFIINHCVGCAWYFIARMQDLGPSTWFAAEGLAGSDVYRIYLRSIYWALTTLTTVGYGDITPESNLETVFTMGVMLMGVSMYAYTIGNIASLIANLDHKNAVFRQKMDAMNRYMSYRDLPSDLQLRVRQYYEYLWSFNKGMDEEEILNNLSPSLRTEVAVYLNRDIIQQVPLFKGCSTSFIEALVMKLKAQIVGPGEYIIRQGDIGHEMYFISKGDVEIVSEDKGLVLGGLKEGDFFGEVALLYTERRTASVKAKTGCHLFVLTKADLDGLLDYYPEFAEPMHRNARRKHEQATLIHEERGSLWRPEQAK